MLLLTRRAGEAIRIGDDIIVKIFGWRGNQARLGVEAPKHLPVHREEVYERIQQAKRGGAGDE